MSPYPNVYSLIETTRLRRRRIQADSNEELVGVEPEEMDEAVRLNVQRAFRTSIRPFADSSNMLIPFRDIAESGSLRAPFLSSRICGGEFAS
jgi:hypothetical protein